MNKKMSEFTEATQASNTDIIPIVQNGENKKITKENLLKELEDLTGIDDFDLNTNDGYIRLKNGIQYAWKQQTVTAGGNEWAGIYYSEHALGNWKKPFSTIFSATCNPGARYYWTANNDFSNTSSGNIRCFRPNSATLSMSLRVFGIGTWKDLEVSQ